MRIEPVLIKKEDQIHDLMTFYMGKNTPDRQNFIIDNLVIEEDRIGDVEEETVEVVEE